MTNRLRSFNKLTAQQVHVKIVDVGASLLESPPPYAPMLQAGDADVIGFEPNHLALQKLNDAKRPNETYLPHAVGDGKRRDLHFCYSIGMTSLLEPNQKILELFHGFPEWGKVIRVETVDTVRLDDVPETAGADLLKIDIQGAELLALQNAEARLVDLLVIHTEVEFLPMYVDQPLFSDVDMFLRQRGFILHRFYPATSRTLRPLLVNNDIYAGLGQLVWADAIFVRDFSRLEQLSASQLNKFAAIMHDCYRAYDIALHLLNELDRRSGTTLEPAYLAGLQPEPV